ncbi:MOSC domain-containing protein [Neorhizobium sp. NPDC001467]|uniref:MOSC domain-containing protein n=1 Tax=Neorhizobium sp. NPDC001467 TaxID=3390595 RepID=UPI003D060271
MIVRQLWKYPVASLGGQAIERIEAYEDGVIGDRDLFLVDLATGEVAAPEKQPRWRPALQLWAYWQGSVAVVAASNWQLSIDNPDLDDAISAHFGFHCGVRAAGTVLVAGERKVEVKSRYAVSPLHLIALDEVNALQAALPNSNSDIRRFRPNIVLEGEWPVAQTSGANFSIGAITAAVTEPTKRCGMTMIAQPGLGEDPEILRTIVRTRSRCLGVYATVIGAGTVSVGDRLLTN